MTDLSGRQRELLSLLQANCQRGLIFSHNAAVPKAYARPLQGLRTLGLIEAGSFRPIERSAIVEAAPAKPALAARGRWDADRKARLLQALSLPNATVSSALVAIGLSAFSKARFQDARRADPAFDHAVIQALGARSSAQPRAKAKRTSREVTPSRARPLAGKQGHVIVDEFVVDRPSHVIPPKAHPRPTVRRSSPAAPPIPAPPSDKPDADLTPFERQLRAVEKGAPVVSTFRPTRSFDHVTLGGVAGPLV